MKIQSESKTSKPKTVTIIGFGRFGQTLLRLLGSDFDIVIWTKHPHRIGKLPSANVRVAKDLREAFNSEVIFYCVPIGKFENIIKSHEPLLTAEHLIIDTLSVKMHPAQILKGLNRRLGTRSILTHPMFGPDSSKSGFKGLPLVLDKFTATAEQFRFWRKYFEFKGLNVVLMKPKQHDKLAANSQGVAHFIGRLLEDFGFNKTSIDTLGVQKLHEVMQQTCNDTWQLFNDLQVFNPYTRAMRKNLFKSSQKVIDKLLPQSAHKDLVVFGIQGGRGSFNEQALHKFLRQQRLKKFKIEYLFTTEKVLSALEDGLIDFGLFAIENARGGLVIESIQALSRHNCQIKQEIIIPIRHFLMKRKDINRDQLKRVMAHDQVFRQCESTLSKKYPGLKQTTGRGDMIDTAKAAEALSSGRIPRTTAVLGPKELAELFNLEIIDSDLQDDKINKTSFLLVKRR